MDNGVLSEFESLTGMRIKDSYEAPETKSFTIDGECFTFRTKRTYLLESVGAEVLAYDSCGNPTISVFKYGKGTVTYLNFPLEDNLIDGHDAFSGCEYKIYGHLFSNLADAHPIKVIGKDVYSTYHEANDKLYVVSINHSKNDTDIEIVSDEYKLSRVHYGSDKAIKSFDAAVFEFTK